MLSLLSETYRESRDSVAEEDAAYSNNTEKNTLLIRIR